MPACVMSAPQPPQPARLIVSVLLRDRDRLPAVTDALSRRLGPVAGVGSWLPFPFTDYYTAEMGKPLSRSLLSFSSPIRQSDLAAVKRFTNRLEGQFSQEGRRTVNLDPGYLLGARFVLASGKNFAHRIYIGGGIYADLTLLFSNGRFQPLPWTYPDYREAALQDQLAAIRTRYLAELRGGREETEKLHDPEHDGCGARPTQRRTPECHRGTPLGQQPLS
jgi:hypothetical protein